MTHEELVMILNMLKNKEMEIFQIDDLEIIYNHYMNGGEWEVFNKYSDHTEYGAYNDVDELADLILDYI